MSTPFELEPAEIGQRVRTVRRRRGLSLDTAAGLAGISKAYLSMLENGERRFERRGLLEDLANALGCSVVDLTGQPYLPGDRARAEALATLPPISIALFDATLDDVPTCQRARSTTSRSSPARQTSTPRTRDTPSPVEISARCSPNCTSML